MNHNIVEQLLTLSQELLDYSRQLEKTLKVIANYTSYPPIDLDSTTIELARLNKLYWEGVE